MIRTQLIRIRFLSPKEILLIAQENKYLWIFIEIEKPSLNNIHLPPDLALRLTLSGVARTTHV